MGATDVALRFVIYAHGAALLGCVALVSAWGAAARRCVAFLAAAGVVLTAAGILRLASNLSDSGAAFDSGAIRMLLTETPAGWAALTRAALLSVLAIASFGRVSRKVALALALAASVALVWTGHAAMGDGAAGWTQLIGDAAHLVAGLLWIGAVGAFMSTASRQRRATPDLEKRLVRFATIGTALVVVLAATGIANALFILGPAGLRTVGETLYGRLLMAKIALFAAMLGAAAVNRYRIVPEMAGDGGLTRLRASLSGELALGLGILALVAWLGTLDPAA